MNLGLVATGKRSIRDGSQYDKYFTDQVEGNEIELRADGDAYDTLKLMKSLVSKTKSQTKDISKVLKGKSLDETCGNLWKFLYNHVQYKKDNPLREQLRTPARTWKDRKAGVDCDCYSIFISSVLSNLGIPHCYRMAGYDGDFQHVYVVVPKDGKTLTSRAGYLVIDPVVNQYNYEAPFSKKHDHKMPQVTMLNGLGACNPKPEILRLRKFVDTEQIMAWGKVPTKQFLDARGIPYVPVDDKANDRSLYVIQTPTGNISVPTVITKEQAQQLTEAILTPAEPTTKEVAADAVDKISKTAKKFNWWWLLIGAGAWILLTGDDQNEVKSGLNGLNGNKKPMPAKVSPPAKKKLKVISI